MQLGNLELRIGLERNLFDIKWLTNGLSVSVKGPPKTGPRIALDVCAGDGDRNVRYREMKRERKHGEGKQAILSCDDDA